MRDIREVIFLSEFSGSISLFFPKGGVEPSQQPQRTPPSEQADRDRDDEEHYLAHAFGLTCDPNAPAL